jgi:hypothetical protein
LVHRCDGQVMTIWLGKEGKYHRNPQPCDGGCQEVGRLALIIPELVRAGYVGYVTLQTTGLNDMLSIQASLLAAWAARAGNPLGLKGIQWNVRRVKEKISTPGENGKRVRREKWMVKVEPAADWVQLQLEQAHAETMALPAPRAKPAATIIDSETGEIIETADDDYQDEPEEMESEAQPVAPAAETAPTPERQDASDGTWGIPMPASIIHENDERLRAYVEWEGILRGCRTQAQLRNTTNLIAAKREALGKPVVLALQVIVDEVKPTLVDAQ